MSDVHAGMLYNFIGRSDIAPCSVVISLHDNASCVLSLTSAATVIKVTKSYVISLLPSDTKHALTLL